MLRDSHSYETQIIDAVRSVNRALGGTYGKSSAIYKSEFNQYEVQLIDAIKGVARTLSGGKVSLGGSVGDLSGYVTQQEFQSLSARVTKLENESFFRLVDGNVTLKTQYNNLWVPGWLAAGGVGTGGGGGGGSSYLKELLDIYHDTGGILRANGDPVANGDALVYDSTTDPLNPRWVAAASSGGVTVTNYGGSTTGRIATVNGIDIYNDVKWGAAGTNPNTFTLSINGTTKTVCLDGYGGGTDLASVWNSLTNVVTDEYANTKINLSHIPNITTGMVTDLETWIAGKGYLTSFTETDPTVPSWAKEPTKPPYTFSEITNKPTTLQGYGIVDATFGTPGSDNVPITLGSTTISVLTAHQDLTPLTNRITAIEDWFEVVNVGTQASPMYALHAKQGRAIYSDSWVAAGGVGSGGGGGATSLGGLSDVTINLSTLANGQALVYRNGMWGNEAVSDGGSVNSIMMNGVSYSPSPAGVVDLGTVITSPPSYSFSDLTSHPTTISGYGITDAKIQNGTITLGNNTITPLTSFTETDPTVPAWAKAANPLLYIGTTPVRTSSNPQDMTGILSVQASSSLLSKFIWDGDHDAWRFMGNLYADGWVAAGGIGSGGGGGATSLGGLSDVTINLSTLANGQALVYRNGLWGNEAVSYNLPIASSSRLGGIKVGEGLSINSSTGVLSGKRYLSQLDDVEVNETYQYDDCVLTYEHSTGLYILTPKGSSGVTSIQMNGVSYPPSPAGVVDLGTVITSLSGYATQTWVQQRGYATETWVQQQGYLTSFAETDPTVPSWAKASSPPSYSFSDLTSHPTTISGYGITDAKIQNGTITLGNNTITPLTSETDPTVPNWAKASNPPLYSFSDLTSHPTTISGYGITDAKIQNGTITLGNNTITPLTSETDPTVPNWAKAPSKPSYSLSEISGTTDLQAIEALLGTGLLRRTGTNTWTLDTTNYLSSHQSIYSLTLSAGSFSAGTYDPKTSTGNSFSIPTTLDHISDGTTRKLSDYVTLGTTQTITGSKTFTTNPVTIGSTSGLSVHESSYIDIGPVRIKFENDAIHITKKSSSDTKQYGIYADGFVAAGGLNS